MIDLSDQNERHVMIAAGTTQTYQGHPTTLLMPNGKTMHCVWCVDRMTDLEGKGPLWFPCVMAFKYRPGSEKHSVVSIRLNSKDRSPPEKDRT